MKYIIVGLGNFGASLAQKLTASGNEVIAIDKNMEKVELYKEKISHTICMDATDELTVSGLPLKDAHMVIVAIGEDQGANVMATALFKNLKVKKLISRSINHLQEKVLEAIGVDEIVHPEEETAERWAKKLCIKHVIDSFELNRDFSVIEANVPSEFVGKTIEEVGFRNRYKLLILTTIKKSKVASLVGKTHTETNVKSIATPDQILEADDILVMYGLNRDLESFLATK